MWRGWENPSAGRLFFALGATRRRPSTRRRLRARSTPRPRRARVLGPRRGRPRALLGLGPCRVRRRVDGPAARSLIAARAPLPRSLASPAAGRALSPVRQRPCPPPREGSRLRSFSSAVARPRPRAPASGPCNRGPRSGADMARLIVGYRSGLRGGHGGSMKNWGIGGAGACADRPTRLGALPARGAPSWAFSSVSTDAPGGLADSFSGLQPRPDAAVLREEAAAARCGEGP